MRVLLTLAWCLLCLITPVRAQEQPSLLSLEISLWPEYDRPEVLVIYRGQLLSDTPLPVPVEIRLPARVGAPSAMAYVDEEGQRLDQQYTTRVEADWLVVAFELGAPGFQLEYYDRLPVDPEGKREYTFTYTADYDVQSLRVDFQVPPNAQGFTLAPPADSVLQETDGLTYHLVQGGSMAMGEAQSWTFAYQKAGSDLTVSALGTDETPEGATASAAGGPGGSDALVLIGAFLALLSVGAGAFWLGRRTRSTSEVVPYPSQRQKRRGSGQIGRPPSRPVSPAVSEETFFCRQCGAELRPDAAFCHRCGAPIRGK